VLDRLKPIPFVIRSAVAMPDPVGGGSHEQSVRTVAEFPA
jgi:hypothetical protein